MLQGLTLMGRDAEATRLVDDDLGASLPDGDWYSTQSVAFALVSVARWAQAKPPEPFTLRIRRGHGARSRKVTRRRAGGACHAARAARPRARRSR